MTELNEDYTAAVLAGTPFFCVNRTYRTENVMPHIVMQYKFKFDNGCV